MNRLAILSQYWYIRPKANGWYEISSVYLKHQASYGQTLYTFTVQTSAGYPVATNVNTDAINQEWKFVYSGGAYNIITKAMLDYKLYVANSTATPAIAANPIVNNFWSIVPVNIDQFWANRYTNYPTVGTTVHIIADYYPDLSNAGFGAFMFEDLDCWDSISSKIKVYTASQYLNAPANAVYVTYDGFDIDDNIRHGIIIPETALGITIPIKENGSAGSNYINDDWKEVKIYLNTTPGVFYNHTYMAKTVIHEFGHALKLAHPRDYFPNQNNSAILSIMNWGDPTSAYNLTTLYPSTYDKLRLISKWEN